MAYGNSYREVQHNSKRLSDVSVVKAAADGYYAAKGEYPEPTGNRIYYDRSGSYAHSATGAYGVSSQVTDDLFGAEFLSQTPVDPQTGAPYGYGKRKDGTPGCDIASVDRRDDKFYAYVRGTYDASALPSLIREYSGPYFVEHGGERLPYNPYERLVTGKIASWSGTVRIVPDKPLTDELRSGDTITVEAGGSAIFHLSDGTEASVGATDSKTEVRLGELETSGDKGFLSRVRLALVMGEIGVRAPRLRDARDGRSELEISSGNAVATVRGTVFGMRRPEGATATTVNLTVGKLFVETAGGEPISFSGSPEPGILEVPEGGTPKEAAIADAVPNERMGQIGTETTSGLSWNSTVPMWRPENFRIWRNASSSEVRIGFLNSAKFTKAGLVAPSPNADAATVGSIVTARPLDASAKYVTAEFSESEVARAGSYDAAYPTDQNAGATVESVSTVRIEFAFCRETGDCFRMEKSIPVDGEFDFDESILPHESSVDCPKNQKPFHRFGCQDASLVAIATYDQVGDLNLYDERGKKLPIATNYVAAADASGIAYKNGFSRTAGPSTDQVGGMRNSFKTTAEGARGVVLDTGGNDGSGNDILEYDLSPLGIKPEHFKIEVDVQGSGLFRKSGERWNTQD